MPRYASLASLLMLGLFLASCGGATYKCTDLMGCLEIPPGSPLVIGVILAHTGEYAISGTDILENVEQAIADKGDIFGHPIELIQHTTDCTPESAQIAALELATHSDLVAVIGPTCAAETEIAVPILINAGIAMLSPTPDPVTAYDLTNQALYEIEQTAVLQQDQTLYIPRQALLETINPIESATHHP